MNINVNYGNRVIVLPAAVADYIDVASGADISVLLAVVELSGRGNTDIDTVANKLGLSKDDVKSSLDFWINNKILSASEEITESDDADKVTATAETPSKKRRSAPLKRSDEIPRYTTEELAVILEKRKETSHLIDECQQIFGKMFNTHEINIVLGLVDYLALGWDYVFELLEFCAKHGKHSLNYVERTAFSMMDEGIDTVEALKEKLKELDKLKENESFVRKLFGMKSRALTAKEKKCITQWFGKLGYSREMVERAYEITVSATNEPSVPYANAILERWYAEGLKDLEDVDKAEAERIAQSGNTPQDGSFDTDDFFESALQRSYNKK